MKFDHIITSHMRYDICPISAALCNSFHTSNTHARSLHHTTTMSVLIKHSYTFLWPKNYYRSNGTVRDLRKKIKALKIKYSCKRIWAVLIFRCFFMKSVPFDRLVSFSTELHVILLLVSKRFSQRVNLHTLNAYRDAKHFNDRYVMFACIDARDWLGKHHRRCLSKFLINIWRSIRKD